MMPPTPERIADLRAQCSTDAGAAVLASYIDLLAERVKVAEGAPAAPSTDSAARFVLCTQVAYGEELPEGARLHFTRYTREPILPVRGLTMHYESDPLPLDTARAVLLALASAGFPTAMKAAR